jgi:hypothetical protein
VVAVRSGVSGVASGAAAFDEVTSAVPSSAPAVAVEYTVRRLGSDPRRVVGRVDVGRVVDERTLEVAVVPGGPDGLGVVGVVGHRFGLPELLDVCVAAVSLDDALRLVRELVVELRVVGGVPAFDHRCSSRGRPTLRDRP